MSNDFYNQSRCSHRVVWMFSEFWNFGTKHRDILNISLNTRQH